MQFNHENVTTFLFNLIRILDPQNDENGERLAKLDKAEYKKFKIQFESLSYTLTLLIECL